MIDDFPKQSEEDNCGQLTMISQTYYRECCDSDPILVELRSSYKTQWRLPVASIKNKEVGQSWEELDYSFLDCPCRVVIIENTTNKRRQVIPTEEEKEADDSNRILVGGDPFFFTIPRLEWVKFYPASPIKIRSNQPRSTYNLWAIPQ